MSCSGTDGADGCGEKMEKIEREYKGPLIDAVLDKLDEIVDGYNEIKGELGDIIDSYDGLKKRLEIKGR